MVKPIHLSKQTQQSIKVFNNTLLQNQIINTKHAIKEQKKINNNFDNINVNKK